MRIFKLVTLINALVFLISCASKPETIAAVPYPDQAYQGMTCDEVRAEAFSIRARVMETSGRQRSDRKKDQGMTLAGAFLPLPMIFLTEGNTETATRLALLKGKYDAILRVSAKKECNGSNVSR